MRSIASLIAADANKQRSAAGSDEVDWQALARTRRSIREYLETLDEAAWGAASETVPKFISKSDPAAQWTGAHKGHAFFAYANNYLIDLKVAIIVDVEATRAIRQARPARLHSITSSAGQKTASELFKARRFGCLRLTMKANFTGC